VATASDVLADAPHRIRPSPTKATTPTGCGSTGGPPALTLMIPGTRVPAVGPKARRAKSETAAPDAIAELAAVHGLCPERPLEFPPNSILMYAESPL
jgi:hypothetical protein